MERIEQGDAGDGVPSYRIVPDEEGDAAGHGTACAAIIRRIAPDAGLTSVRILGPGLAGDGNMLLAALRWAVAERFHVVNLSLSSRKGDFKASLHDIADEAYFNRVAIVASAHNSPVRSFPWIFPSVISVGSHEIADAERLEVSPRPPSNSSRPVSESRSPGRAAAVRSSPGTVSRPRMSPDSWPASSESIRIFR